MARRLAVLPQAPETPPHLTVRDLVEQGRFPHVGLLQMLRRQDHEAIDRAIEVVGLESMLHRDVDTLSGGERQRAWIAFALAQDTPFLALDEPTTFLDLGHQFEVLELVRWLNRERGLTVAMVLHDLNHAAAFSDRLVVISDGQIVRSGRPADVLDEDLLRDVFGVEARIETDPAHGHPVIMPFRSSRGAPMRSLVET